MISITFKTTVYIVRQFSQLSILPDNCSAYVRDFTLDRLGPDLNTRVLNHHMFCNLIVLMLHNFSGPAMSLIAEIHVFANNMAKYDNTRCHVLKARTQLTSQYITCRKSNHTFSWKQI